MMTSFKIKEGTIHAIVGENGAGKSTLMKILYGMQKQDEGTIKIFDNEQNFFTKRCNCRRYRNGPSTLYAC